MEKECSKCHEVKLYSYFSPDRRRKDGLQSSCRECNKLQKREWRNRNPEHAKDLRRKSRLKNLSREKENYKIWASNNKERRRSSAKIWYKSNKGKYDTWRKQFARNNPGKINLYSSNRKMRILNSIPNWANLDKIEEIYSKSKELEKRLGIKFHVDHIVPIKSKLVCGLHVENNLQLLVPEENLAKLNTYWPDMP